ncbi:hypothetical protein RUM44_006870 [Polyplax serrata]|uniref:Uncharacterized protein n=1 Tax=Polyplax serrata TaxID=468196 RepID=A0ABR1AJD1_POLSC
MQPSARHHSKDKSSRIKFKGEPHLQNVTSNDYDEAGLRARFYDGSYQIINTSSSEDLTEEEDSRNPTVLAECLPPQIYKKIATMWDLDPDIVPKAMGNYCKFDEVQKDEEDRMVDEYIKEVERDIGIRSEVSEDLQVDAGSHVDERMYEDYDRRRKTKKENPYIRFLKKASMADSAQKKAPNLGKKAGKITKMIIGNFMKWYESLGTTDGEDSFIDEHTLHELFQVGFDMPAAKPMAVRIKEMPTVPECLAKLRNEPKHATTYALREFLKQDMRLEAIPTKMFAFGSMLPKGENLRYKPPKNEVRKNWMECSRVPKDLSTMKTVWVGLERLRSTIAFSNWLNNHPEISPPTYLQEKGLLKINYEEWNQMYKGFEFDVSLDTKLSESKISQDKSFPSKNSSALSYSGSLKFGGSSESFL